MSSNRAGSASRPSSWIARAMVDDDPLCADEADDAPALNLEGDPVNGLYTVHHAAQEPAVGSEVGQRAPDFTLPSLDGEKLNLYERVEQVDAVLLYFFFAAT